MPRGHVLPDRQTIAILRGEAGLTQQHLASRAGYGVRTISKIENGQPTSSATLAAIAIVLAETLERPVHLVDLISQPQGANRGLHSPGGALIVAENIKLLEIGSQPRPAAQELSGDASGSAILVDTFRLRYLPTDLEEIEFFYATSGRGLAGRSLSHPEDSTWQTADRTHEPSLSAGGLPTRHVLRVTLANAASPRRLLLQNEVEYIGGFEQPEQRQFYAHVIYPTDCLTLMVRVPAAGAYAALRGRCRRSPGGPWLLAAEQPFDLSAGRMAYWRVVAPTPGETYELGWT